MTAIDYAIFALYMAAVVAVGVYFSSRNESEEDYYVGGRSLTAGHIGMSVVATDVGGGFSIGLGGLGYAVGLSGSWLLFTGLAGAWLSAVLIIPRIKAIDAEKGLLTYPDFLRCRYSAKVAAAAALISAVGYMGFTGAQVLAGAKLMAGTVIEGPVLGLSPLQFSLLFIGTVIIAYTALGGLKAVVYTDSLQWGVLLVGLILFAVPFSLVKVGGFSGLAGSLPKGFFSLTNITPARFFNWMITIIPIWLVAMTAYQRIYACRDEGQAKKAWYIAGLLEYPVMAFTGVFLGMTSRALFPGVEAEMGLPLLIKHVLPAGVTGIVAAAYFSAIMSTADSCLLASSGNAVSDLMHTHLGLRFRGLSPVRVSQLATLAIGLLAMLLAAAFKTVLDAILYAYAFMVSGLFVPTLGAFFWEKSSSAGALAAMLGGGALTVALTLGGWKLPLGLDPVFFGLLLSAAVFVPGSLLFPERRP